MDTIDNNMNNLDKILYGDIIVDITKKEEKLELFVEYLGKEHDISVYYPQLIAKQIRNLILLVNKHSKFLYDDNDFIYLTLHLNNSIEIIEKIINIINNPNLNLQKLILEIEKGINIIDAKFYKILILSINNYNEDINVILDYIDSNYE